VVSTAVDRCLLLHDFDSLPTVGQRQGCWRTSSISLSRQFKDRVRVVFGREKRRKNEEKMRRKKAGDFFCRWWWSEESA